MAGLASAGRAVWKRQRWWAAVAAWVLVAYPLSLGPTMYAVESGWLPTETYVLYVPTMPCRWHPHRGWALL